MLSVSGKVLMIILFFGNVGCSSLNNPTLVTGALSFLGCSAIGATAAPDDERPEMHALLWGSGCAATGMLVSEIIEGNRLAKTQKSTLQNLRADDSLEELKIKNSILNSKNFEDLDFDTKEKLKGNWTVYKTDNWIMDKGKIKHENMEIEFE